MRKFKELIIWKDSIELVTEVYKIANYLPDIERFGMTSQVRRASVSIPSNIAEGCSRRNDTDFARFLEIALGSSFELETQLILINNLKLLSDNQIPNRLFEQINNIQKMTNSFRMKLLKP